ncbi:MAG: SDR family NAD(P)-dependent oxidoreductase [Ruminococcaceae bacterium]|nr:SDR family NAD(P)-dependent oxidoreductase [Oscillospiraceae bacterium]
MKNDKKEWLFVNVLITGAASGIGRAAAERFLARGHRVFGIDRSAAEGFPCFTADITDEAALVKVREKLEAGGITLDAILNIAGMHIMASLVECDHQKMKRAVDVNLTGTILVNRVFHRCLKEDGRILIVTSEVAGLDPLPFNGLYSVTKTALDAYAQALRQELNLLGQKVITVRPGAVETPLCSGSVTATADLADSTELYKKQAKSFSGLAAKFMGRPIKAEKLGALLCKAAAAKHPRYTYKIHRNPGLVLLSALPKAWQCGIIKFLLNLGIF